MPSLLTVAALQVADTVVMLPAHDGLSTAALIADLVLTSTFVLIVATLFSLLIQLRDIKRMVAALVGNVEKRLEPVIDRSREVAANVEFITAAVRTDVQRVSDSVRSLSDRLQHASDRVEQRVEDFNALMEVVQSEAEDIFIGSAATVRGVRAGARALRNKEDGRAVPADDDDALLADVAGLPPRALEPAAVETVRAPQAAPGGVQVTGPVEGDAAGSRANGS